MTQQPNLLKDKLIFVTGASSGIGQATAVECAIQGAELVISGRNHANLHETANKINELTGLNPVLLEGDLTDATFRKSVADKFKGRIIDGIALCAGSVTVSPIAFSSNEKIIEMMECNFLSNADLIRLFLKQKTLRRGSSVAVITSVLGIEGVNVGNAPYGASKAALESWVKYCAAEYAAKGIRFNTIHPGSIATPMLNLDSVTQEQLQTQIDKIPLKRIGRPEEIARPVVFLLSDSSSFMTGSSITVDGGQHLIF